MKAYCFRLQPLGAWCTPWHADSLFSALCLQASMFGGAAFVGEMVEAFRVGNPPFVLSDAFPEDWLPCPLSARLQTLPNSNLQTKLPKWVRVSQFRTLVSQSVLLPAQMQWPEPPLRFIGHLHASIDRSSGTTAGSGELFDIEEICFQSGEIGSPKNLVLYVKTDTWLEKVAALLELLSYSGFGKKRSSGKGAFKLIGSPEPCAWIDEPRSANGFVSLSHFVPAENDPTEGYWSLLTKYPKFSPVAPVKKPFKGRIAMLRPGAAFRTESSVRPFYGKILDGISADFSSAVHYGLAFSVPIYWPR